MNFNEYSRSKQFDYAALAETVASILQAALAAYPVTFRLQQVQHRAKNLESLKKKLEGQSYKSAGVRPLRGLRMRRPLGNNLGNVTTRYPKSLVLIAV